MANAPAKPARWPSLLLLAAALTLAAVDWDLATHEPETTAIAPAPAAETAVHDASAPVSPQKPGETHKALTETLSRPLFRADRRPYIPKAVAPGTQAVAVHAPAMAKPRPPLPSGLKLIGIVTETDGARSALLRTDASQGARSYALGNRIEGWTLTAIDEGSATLAASGEQILLELYGGRRPAIPPAPAAPETPAPDVQTPGTPPPEAAPGAPSADPAGSADPTGPQTAAEPNADPQPIPRATP